MSTTTTQTLTHGSYCQCGKWAKFHGTISDTCGNVCGIHARKLTDKLERSGGVPICDACGDHALSGVVAYSLRGDGVKTVTCSICDERKNTNR